MQFQYQLLQKLENRRQYFQVIFHWQFLAFIAIIISSGVGLLALSQILKLPEFPDCSFATSTTSAATRLYCAQEFANQQTVDDLFNAINFVNSVSREDPLRPQIDNSIQKWSIAILNQGEAEFQQGRLEQAIAIVHQIPVNALTDKLVNDRIKFWKLSWSKAEAIYADTETQIQQNNWQQAYSQAVKLLNVDNQYWQTTKYQQLVATIDNLQKDSEEQQEIKERGYLEKARQLALSDDVDGLTTAVAEAGKIPGDSPRFDEAQQLVLGWQNKLELSKDRAHLDLAETLASKNDTKSLQAAATEASKIETNRPLYQEAQQKIQQWQAQSENLEARSHLNNVQINHVATVATKADINAPPTVAKKANFIAKNPTLPSTTYDKVQQWDHIVKQLQNRIHSHHKEVKTETVHQLEQVQPHLPSGI